MDNRTIGYDDNWKISSGGKSNMAGTSARNGGF